MKQRGVAIVISTADRSPRQNYLLDTLNNLHRSGVFKSQIIRTIVVDTGIGVLQRTRAAIWFASHKISVEIVTPIRHRSSPHNAATGMFMASTTGAEWVLFLEDDIEVCGSFLESVSDWLSDNATPEVPVYPFCAAYGKSSGRHRDTPWPYPINAFYGTQAYAVRAGYCWDLGTFLEGESERRGMSNGHDLLLKEWVQIRFPNLPNLLCPGMDFVQHVGKESSIHPGRFHQYPNFGGPDYSYARKATTYYGPEELKRSLFSPKLAKLLTETLDRSLPVYDLGCGIGRYVSELERAGFVALGIEGHPHAPSVAVTPSIIVADVSEGIYGLCDIPTGSVISLEVGEHIHPERAGQFLDNLSAFCKRTLILSWAIRGQGGHRHIHELDEQEIVPMVEARGFRLDREKTAEWRKTAGDDLRWFKRSIYCFDRI